MSDDRDDELDELRDEIETLRQEVLLLIRLEELDNTRLRRRIDQLEGKEMVNPMDPDEIQQKSREILDELRSVRGDPDE